MYRVCGLRLVPNFVVWLAADNIFISGKRLRKCIRLRFLTINIYGHMVVATRILRLRSTVQIQELKY